MPQTVQTHSIHDFEQAANDWKTHLDQVAAEKAQAEAKAEQARLDAIQTQAAPVYSGSHTDWMTQAGIDPANFPLVDYIVTRESGWNPNAVNRSSGACGIGQQLPCGKWAGAWNDPIAGLVAMQGYVNARYGGWAGAYAYWQSHGNY